MIQITIKLDLEYVTVAVGVVRFSDLSIDDTGVLLGVPGFVAGA